MYDHALYRSTSAELIRRAEAERDVRLVRLARRAERRAGRGDPGGRVSRGRGRGRLAGFVRAALRP
ncbi:hypothetical protein ACFW6N_05430 [Streptomyces cyaneofuscatus]|uniref:hypothetical protein n=1 Tax=Streptomyces cyaneofuscatus TaxID=66883 RepID=UPI00345DADFF